jgi:hypothetical protein
MPYLDWHCFSIVLLNVKLFLSSLLSFLCWFQNVISWWYNSYRPDWNRKACLNNRVLGRISSGQPRKPYYLIVSSSSICHLSILRKSERAILFFSIYCQNRSPQ